jgi:4-hydroxy-tetrahydrodipicolinate reductase
MTPTRVVVHGALGKMGQEVLRALAREPDLTPAGAADKYAAESSLQLPDAPGSIPLSRSLSDVLRDASVVVDFSGAEGANLVMRTAAARKVNIVIGSTGMPEASLQEAAALADEHEIGIFIAPNFAIGAVLMMHLAEMHHEGKIDAPSGTALAIARAVVEGKGSPFTAPKAEKELISGTRGGTLDGVTIHSARMPGRVAHHDLVFGGLGQTLTIRHDSVSRESFMPGVMMAVREVGKRPGLTVGLDKIMGL